MFPFIPGTCDLSVDRVAVFLSMSESDCGEHVAMAECPCPVDEELGSHIIEVTHGAQQRQCEPFRVVCAEVQECQDLYGGVFDARLPPIKRSTDGRRGEFHPELSMRFARDIGEIENIYLLCRYERHERPVESGMGARSRALMK
jgi:hypothetical protein